MPELAPLTRRRSTRRGLHVALVLLTAAPATAQSADLYLEGTDARAMALGGATTAAPESPLTALAFNPAGLAGGDGWRVAGSLTGARVSGEYDNRVSVGNGMGRQAGAIGSLGVSWGRDGVAVGFAAQPVNAWLVDWEYPDVPGTAGARYANVDQRALFLNYRFGLGGAIRVTDRLSLGGSAGLVYNRNELDAPYVFQTQPALQGVKVDIDLVADSFEPNFNLGLLFTASDAVRIGLSWTSRITFASEGELVGTADAQFEALGLGGTPADLTYDAVIETGLPQMISLGVSVAASERLAVVGQLDRVGWSESFGALGVNLRNGTNAAVNGLVGDDALTDDALLDWESTTVARLGVAYALDDALTGRFGISHGESPVPDRTLTPLSGPIVETTLSAGLGWRTNAWDVGFAYQFELPSERRVGTSGLLAGEYSDTRTRVSIHRLTVSVARPL